MTRAIKIVKKRGRNEFEVFFESGKSQLYDVCYFDDADKANEKGDVKMTSSDGLKSVVSRER